MTTAPAPADDRDSEPIRVPLAHGLVALLYLRPKPKPRPPGDDDMPDWFRDAPW